MIDYIVELVLAEARRRVNHELSYALHEVFAELSDRTYAIYLTLIYEEWRKKEDEKKKP